MLTGKGVRIPLVKFTRRRDLCRYGRKRNAFRIIPTAPRKVAGISPEQRPVSSRKGGRFHVGIVAGLVSEWWPNWVGIRNWELLHHIFPEDRNKYIENVQRLLKPQGHY